MGRLHKFAHERILSNISSVPTLFEQDQLFIGNVLDVVGDDLRK
jgi:hypothetical protein